MNTYSKNQNNALINFLLITFRGIFLLSSITLIIGGIVMIIDLITNKPTFPVDLPVSFSFTDSGIILTTDTALFAMPYAKGVILTEDLPNIVVVFSYLGSLLYLLCQLLEAAQSGTFLILENTVRLRGIAILILSACLIEVIHTTLSSLYLSDKLEYSGVQFVYSPMHTFFYGLKWEYIFCALFLLVIAEAFRVGSQMKQENDLTI